MTILDNVGRDVSLARASLRYEWRRYLAAVLAVTFAGLLVVVQLALLLGLFSSVSTPITYSAADLWIGYRNTQSVDMGRPIPTVSDTDAWIHPDVTRVERYLTAYGDLRRDDGVAVSVILHAIDPSPGGLGFSVLLSPEQRELLDEPGGIIIAEADMKKLGARVGSVLEINNRRVTVVGVTEAMRAIGSTTVICSLATARTLLPEQRGEVTYYLVGLRPGADSRAAARTLDDKGPIKRYSVWEANAFSIQSELYWLLESGAGVGTAFASLLALVVGVVITNQTLSGAIQASSKEYAALRALGVSKGALKRVVLEQSFWIGTVGLSLTAVLFALTAVLAAASGVAMVFPLWLILSVVILIYLIALTSGLMSLKPLMNTDPATLLR
ncbi:MAG: ABC transporter permease [Humidesulfovibrio sp.]|uniref:ABC transporter permease n=1 Tax=Humidesulfovibrio sp. TaxID=2910988 RepID=UPI002736C2D7|nr:ABC transporter permease [Humidesulfovibrio sp.]MDP2846798.1 ABC transporter permease [Humidesulfovibrio sp.]